MYTINVINNSSTSQDFVIFQKPPVIDDIFPLAWNSKFLPSYGMGEFQIESDYGFTFGKGSDLRPGAIFNPSQIMPAKLQGKNKVSFNGVELSAPEAGDSNGFTITEGSGVPMNEFAIGLAMDGRPIFATRATPNKEVVFPEPNKSYYIAFGQFSQSQILDEPLLINKGVEVCFDNYQRVSVTLEPSGKWFVNPY